MPRSSYAMPVIHRKTLTNGLRAVCVAMPHLHSAEVAVYIKSGSSNDPAGCSGVAHFLEHILFRGTTEYPSSLQLETAFEEIGGNVNATTDEECTCYFSRVHPTRTAAAIELFSSMLLRPTLSQIETEKRIITEEALEDLNEQGEEINTHNLTSRIFWPGHPLGQSTVGTLESIAALTVDDLRTYMALNYVPSNALIVAAGPLEPDSFFSAVESHFGEWPAAQVPGRELWQDPCIDRQPLFVHDSDSQIHLQISFLGIPRRDHRMTECRLLRRILAGGGCSRLHLLLREELGIVYSVDAAIAAYEETGYFSIEMMTAPENLVTAVTSVLKELDRLCRETVPEDELQRVKQGYLFDMDYSVDSPYEMQVRYGWGDMMEVHNSIEDERILIDGLGSDQIRSFAQGLFQRKKMALVAVGPTTGADREKIIALLAEYLDPAL